MIYSILGDSTRSRLVRSLCIVYYNGSSTSATNLDQFTKIVNRPILKSVTNSARHRMRCVRLLRTRAESESET
jgi:hypothetical protein